MCVCVWMVMLSQDPTGHVVVVVVVVVGQTGGQGATCCHSKGEVWLGGEAI